MIGPRKRAVGACSAGIRIAINKKSCVAATYRSDCVAATQLFIFDGGFETLWPRAPHGALAIGYYSKRCSAAICRYAATSPKARPIAVGARVLRARREHAFRRKKHSLLARQPSRPKAA